MSKLTVFTLIQFLFHLHAVHIHRVHAALVQGVSEVSCGGYHTCTVGTSENLDKVVQCWGSNSIGQLGLGDTTDRYGPVTVTALGRGSVAQLAVGGLHTCSVSTSGALQCWGDNSKGQLGLGDLTNRDVPTTAFGGSVAKVALGTSHTCAVLTSGALQCWGDNSKGQLGLGDTTGRNASTTVIGDSVAQVALGGLHTCSVSTSGTLQCWGDNSKGQLGLGDTTDRNVPAAVTTIGGSVMQVSLGNWHSCALLTNGAVRCWGYNLDGRLGLDDAVDRDLPTPVIAIGGSVSQIALGGFHSCAVLTNGTLQCWGDNANGQLGFNDTTHRYIPTTVTAIAGSAAQIDLGTFHTCAVLSNATTLQCWGSNFNGQLGLCDNADRYAPIYVAAVNCPKNSGAAPTAISFSLAGIVSFLALKGVVAV